jgi:DNA-binding IclR family transcriptional regulator
VALTVEALEWYASGRTWHQWLPDSAGDKARKALAVLQSTDAPAQIRREVARECAEIVEQTGVSQKGPFYNREDDGEETLKCVASAIRVQFGVKKYE